jgi:restriction system protein
VGVYISLGGFTGDCESLSRRTSRRVTLIDGDDLLNLWFEYFDRLDEDGRQLLPIKRVYYLDPSAGAT